jgi:hypothetical protein
MMDDKREELAALEHQQWAHWTRYMLKTLEPLLSPNLRWHPDFRGNAEAALERWLRQINTPYADLTEEEKDADREWADKVLNLFAEVEQLYRRISTCKFCGGQVVEGAGGHTSSCYERMISEMKNTVLEEK